MGFAQLACPPKFRGGDVERNGDFVDSGAEWCRDRSLDTFTGGGDGDYGFRQVACGGDFHLDIDPGTLGRNLLLTVEDIADAGAVPALQIDRAPDTRGHEARTPVPAVVVTRLTGEDAHAFVEEPAVGRLVVDGFVTVGQRVVFGQVDFDRRVKIDFQGVFAGME